MMVAPSATELIPTRYRTKIPERLSYPVGAKALSDALLGINQFDQLILRFYYWNDFRLRSGKYEFIRIEYRNRSESTEWTRHGLYNRYEQYRGEIVVQPVPRTLRNRVNTLVTKEALPAIRLWLEKHKGLDRQGSDLLSFNYDESLDAMSIDRADKLEPARG
ncbi:hypothetical protein SAMN05421819_0903 [Bryocella elongata]|uniref:Uncharacterized protein n=1 Tax=Bryocella elongata TaxID=863522 RepID=A0A1H5U9S7_9BACT|nr:hypothetical protein [Bryocella elongata]SEF71081.1 hypothetical protein SAMN05421819_0903 [Bryocella elongata]